jgi:hypothetical protein
MGYYWWATSANMTANTLLVRQRKQLLNFLSCS